MEFHLLVIGSILVLCVLSGKLSNRLGMPVLLIFLGLGMLFGSNGLFKIPFDDYQFAEQICSNALIFIMFYGGFSTNWNAAKPVAKKAILLSSAGVALTAVFVGLFCYLALGFTLYEGMLIGSVMASTDAASVFSILRGKKLSLKNGLDSLLELESGSNDPTAYTLTVLSLSLIVGGASVPSALFLIFRQICFGLLCGFLCGKLAVFAFQRLQPDSNGQEAILMVAVALLSYAIPTALGGNGFLSVYITGILLGNSRIAHKAELVHFFDGVTGIMQIALFFLLGLLSFPSQIPAILPVALAIVVFLSFVARPAAVFLLLTPMRVTFREQILISWAGLRGAASIVFAILTVISDAYTKNDVFHIVFCVSLFSLAFQGALLPLVSRKLRLIDEEGNVLKTFNDYQESHDINLIEMPVPPEHQWANKSLSEISFPPGMLAVMVRRGGQSLVPRGGTVLLPGDTIVFNCARYQDDSDVRLLEVGITEQDPWAHKTFQEINLPENMLAVMIRRDGQILLPKGMTVILPGDTVTLCGPELQPDFAGKAP